jgi:3',5'-cyclic AMP phosphodiesterase CpdA
MQLEPINDEVPLYAAVGNHEHVPGNITANGTVLKSAFAAFEARYPMPVSAPGVFWWSSDIGPLHLVFMSSEHDFDVSSAQWAWARGDLAAVDRSATPWVAVVLHRPIYSAAVLEWEDHSPGGKLAVALEPLLQGGAVDLVLQGHIHSFDRTHAVRNGTVIQRGSGQGNSTYASPGAPIYVVQGTSGALPENVFFDPPPVWSAARNLGSFGYGRLHVNASALAYEYVGLTGVVLDQFWITK